MRKRKIINELEKSSEFLYKNKDNWQSRSRRKRLIKHFAFKLMGNILDIGCDNPLRHELCDKYNLSIDGTGNTDLDTENLKVKFYSTVLCLDVIEHLFNPLHCLIEIKRVMYNNTKLYVGLPSRGKLLWAKGHFHEIDSYRFNLLCKKAGFKIVHKMKYKVWRHPLSYFTGIRMFLRLFFEYGIIYELEINDE